jgi:hypothetical protein
MRDFYVEVAWNHKGTRYEKKSYERVTAASVSGAVRAAMDQVKEKEPDSLRAALGSRIHFTVTMIGQERA